MSISYWNILQIPVMDKAISNFDMEPTHSLSHRLCVGTFCCAQGCYKIYTAQEYRAVIKLLNSVPG